MRGRKTTDCSLRDFRASALLVAIGVGLVVGADGPNPDDRADLHIGHHHHTEPASAERFARSVNELPETALAQARRITGWLITWYRHTPPADRVTWGGMTASAVMGLCVLLERLARLRERTIIPPEFTARFLDRLHDGKLDCGQALDHCELNPSPAARVALAAVRRWGRPAADLERAVALAHRVESERLRRNVGTLRRIAVLTPLLGLLGTLFALGRALEAVSPVAAPGFDARTGASALANLAGPSVAWGPLLAAALTPLCAGIIIATVALVAYDGLLTRIEKLAGLLDRLGAETIDAIALTVPISSPAITFAPLPVPARTPHQAPRGRDDHREPTVRSSEHETGF